LYITLYIEIESGENMSLLKKLIVTGCVFFGPLTGWAALAGVSSFGEKTIADVPAYRWQHGCAPTAAGMVLGYWDAHGFPLLIPGDASTQTNAVNQVIASDEHYQDYALPKDDSTTGLLADASELGGAHTNNCLADYMKTSFSSLKLSYGWSKVAYIDDALNAYTLSIFQQYGALYWPSTQLYPYTAFDFADYAALIDQNHPLVLTVDIDGNNQCDHAVTAIGYRDTNGYPEYACWDTWSTTEIRWEPFMNMGAGQEWGVYMAFDYSVIPEPASLLMILLGGLLLRRKMS
jgi:hypothetical protein